ncbi:hypothetical protein IFM89_039511 [Coptis chinensis]|uniref:4-coumarate--CoA ligase n=1 Tax=Coptis chinensis TaxID=261450 RepID=A0A835GTY6_9MAGN|nr:hypothetical protein IFM89_039511 [Coptis chinensis]
MEEQRQGHICQCLRRISRIRLDSPFTIFGNRTKTGLQFVEGVQSLALGLSNLGLKPGHVVAIAALNSDIYLEWMLAVAYIGAIISPLNYRWSLEEARSALEILEPEMLVVDDSCAIWYFELQTYNSLRWHVCLGDPLPFVNHSDNGGLDQVLTTGTLKSVLQTSASLDYQWAPEGIVLICFTSGTSGRPKGVAIGHTALIVQSLAKIAVAGYSEEDVYLHTAPLCHIGGISSGLAMLMVGACHVLLPKFVSGSVLQAIEQYHVSSLITVPAMMADLISYIRSRATWKKGKSMTETCSSLTFMTLNQIQCIGFKGHPQKISEVKPDWDNQLGVCVGKPAPHVELFVNGNGHCSIGRILTRGPHVMLKYWNQVPLKKLDSLHQGWLDTGDIGWLDDKGAVWLIGRSNDRIKSGGENVYPEEVEAVLSQHPGVYSIAVVGVPDARLSEMVVACVQLQEGWKWVGHDSQSPERMDLQLTTNILYEYCKENKMTRYSFFPTLSTSYNKTLCEIIKYKNSPAAIY